MKKMFDKIYDEIESICKREKILEKKYGVEEFDEDFYFTSSQRSEIVDIIYELMEELPPPEEIVQTAISIIKKW